MTWSISTARNEGARKSGGPRSCFKQNGAPKAAFETKKQAERAIPRTSTGLKPYRCEKHGWHLGH
jgi:hypothetical protein